MPQKTIYLSEADAVLWDEFKSSIGEKSMSRLFLEFLRKTLQTRDGFLHVLRAEGGVPLKQALFAVMFAPLGDAGGRAQRHDCKGLADLVQFLHELGLTEKAIETIKGDLKDQASASVQWTLTQAKVALF